MKEIHYGLVFKIDENTFSGIYLKDDDLFLYLKICVL